MKILYLIVDGTVPATDAQLKTAASILKTGGTAHVLPKEESREAAINKFVAELKDDDYTHICLIPEGSELTEGYEKIAEQFVKNDKTVYLPIVQYYDPTDEGEHKFKGLLNTCMWKPYVGGNEYGQVGEQLAVRQIDTTLYGAIIPISILREYHLKIKIKFYSFFEYTSRIAHHKVAIKGIPKVGVLYFASDEIKKATQEERVKYFRACQTLYKKKEDVEVTDEKKVTEPVTQA